jgi:hypothetical protein
MANKERMLPGDYQRKIKYDALDDTTKQVKKPGGFFNFPEKLKGSQDQKQRPFLVFYFEDADQYKAVRQFFELKSTSHSHPELDSVKLFELVNNQK